MDKRLCNGFAKIFANLDNNLKVSIIDSFIRDAKTNSSVDLTEEIMELKNWPIGNKINNINWNLIVGTNKKWEIISIDNPNKKVF